MRILFVLLVTVSVIGAPSVMADEPPSKPRTDEGPGNWTYGPFGYDAAGNITTIGTHYFIYDVNGRLKKAQIDRPNAAGTQTLTQIHEFTYDDFGNMIRGPDASSSLATNPATNHLTALGAAYDAAGNLTQWTPPNTTTNYGYVYDPLGALTQVKVNGEVKQYHVYTADDERIWTFEPPDTSHWKIRDLDGKVLRDYLVTGGGANEAWTAERDYLYRDGQLLAAITSTGVLHFSLDHLGTPRIVTDGAALRVGFHHYFPFGKEWIDTGDADDDEVMKFTGHERDGDPAGGTFGSDYMHARYYNASLGRFFAIDRLHGDRLDPQSWNAYAYVRDSPVTRTDPRGMEDGSGVGWFDYRYTEFLLESYTWTHQSRQWLRRIFDVAAARAFYEDLSYDLAAEGGLADSYLTEGLMMALPESDGELAGDVAVTAVGGKGLKVVGGALVRIARQIGVHALERMAERSVTRKMIDVAIRKGTRYWDPKNKTINCVLEGVMPGGKSLVVGLNPFTGKVTTVIVVNKVSSRLSPIP